MLDLGSGAGYYARLLLDHGARRVVGIDLSPEMLRAGRDPRLLAVVADAASVALRRRFDAVLAAGVLEFVADPVAVLANARRLTAPDGFLVVLVPREGTWGRGYRRYHARHGITVRLFPDETLVTAAAAAGWRVEETRDVWPSARAARLVPASP